ncbi:MAG: hypothetical protein LBE95_00560 [Holosporaceae bacterium]|jgi:hypothetical protein|nr:hypothetical protein [Holosporaceae bacterium]
MVIKNLRSALCWVVLSFLNTVELRAARDVNLDVVAEVDGKLDIERIDTNGSVDAFAGMNVLYRVRSNSNSNVTVTISSTNCWKLKREDDEKHEGDEKKDIPYGVYRQGIKLNSEKTSAETDIQREKFSNCQYQLALVFKADSSTNAPAGKYTDHVVITVASKN